MARAKTTAERLDALERDNDKLRERCRVYEEALATLTARCEGFGIVLEELADYIMADEQEKRRLEEARADQNTQQAAIDAAKKRGAQSWRQRARTVPVMR